MYEFLSFEESLERKKIRGRVLNTLEFTKIRDSVSSKARTVRGRELIDDMVPVCDADYAASELSASAQAMDHILRFGMLPLGGMRDLREAVTYAKAGGTLSCGQLLETASFLRSSEELKKTIAKARSAGAPFVDETEPDICAYIDGLETCEELLEKITNSILGQDEVSDRASKDLSSIRRERKKIAGGIYEKDKTALYKGLLIGYSGGLQHRAVVQQDCYAVDIRCMAIRPEFIGAYEEITGRKYIDTFNDNTADDRFAGLSEEEIIEFSFRVCDEVRKRGLRIIWDPQVVKRI